MDECPAWRRVMGRKAVPQSMPNLRAQSPLLPLSLARQAGMASSSVVLNSFSRDPLGERGQQHQVDLLNLRSRSPNGVAAKRRLNELSAAMSSTPVAVVRVIPR